MKDKISYLHGMVNGIFERGFTSDMVDRIDQKFQEIYKELDRPWWKKLLDVIIGKR